MKRRLLLRTVSSSLPVLAGCPGDFPKYRRVGFDSISVDRGSEEHEISAVVVVEANPEERPWGVYHDVTLLARTEDGSRICSTNIGDIAIGKHSVTLQCTRLPRVLEFDAVELPCDRNTEFERAVRSDTPVGGATWRLVDDECSN